MSAKQKKLFCDLHPACYEISVQKEIHKRHLKDFIGKDKISKAKNKELFPVVVSEKSSNMIKRAPGVDLSLQLNKAVNINLAGSKIDGIVIRPGEVFSFWKTVGKCGKKQGYKEGRVIQRNRLVSGTGGGLCNLGNTIHLLILHSPLEVTEFHQHSDALAPDEGKRVPFSAGTSIRYNYIDYRFKNTTDQNVQLHIWCEGETLNAELRSEREFPHRYELVEEDHHFRKEGEKYYRISKIYRNVIDKATDKVIDKQLVLDNHSEVMFDYDLIPKELIRT